MSVVGIDLGTTNTVVACVRSGKVHVLADEHGLRLLPSVVSFPPNGEVLVGASAKVRRIVDPKNTVYSHKRLLGRSWGSSEIAEARARFAFELREGPGQGALVRARGQDFTLPEISAFVLKRARQIAETALGAPIERAVITVPAHFNELQRASTKVAGRVSGLEVLRILNEPTAAALAYGLGRSGNERVAVYDFGGGTFDCTLLDLNGNVFEVLATAGDSFLGGEDVDNVVAERMAEAYLEEQRYDPRSDPAMLERLRTSAEEIKVRLSGAETHTVVLEDFGPGVRGSSVSFSFTMTRRDLEYVVTPLIERSFKVTQDALALARLTPMSFDKVILVGGSTRIPLVRSRVEAFFGQAPLDRVNPDEVVAIGAAIQAAALTEGARRRSIPAPPAVLVRSRPVPAPVPARQSPNEEASEDTQTGTFDKNASTQPKISAVPSPVAFHPASSVPPSTMMASPVGLGNDRSARSDPEPIVRSTPAPAPSPDRPSAVRTTVEYGVTTRRSNETIRFGHIDDPASVSDPTTRDANVREAFVTTREEPPVASALDEEASHDVDISFMDTVVSPAPAANASSAVSGAKTATLERRGVDPTAIPSSGAPSTLRTPHALVVPPSPGPRDTLGMNASPSSRASFDVTAPMGQTTPLGAAAPMNRTLPMSATAAPLNPTAPRSAAPLNPTAPRSAAPLNPTAPIPRPPALAPSTPRVPGPPFGGNHFPSPSGMFGGFVPPSAEAPLDVGAMAEGYASQTRDATTASALTIPPTFAAPVLVDVTPRALVVETAGGYTDTIIPRNAKIPCERTRRFAPGRDMQTTVRVRVGQGEHPSFPHNVFLGEVELSGLRAAPRGEVVVAVTFEVDADGTLGVRARDVQTGQEAHATLQLVGVADDSSVVTMTDRFAHQRVVGSSTRRDPAP